MKQTRVRLILARREERVMFESNETTNRRTNKNDMKTEEKTQNNGGSWKKNQQKIVGNWFVVVLKK